MIAWELLRDLMIGNPLLDKFNEAELSVRMKDGSFIELKGSDNPDSLRGPGLDGLVLDEWALQNPAILTEILRPALTDKHGWVMKICTPKGKNHAYDDFNKSKEDSRYFFTVKDTNILSQDELDIAREEMGDDQYKQEFECAWLYFSGAIYKEFKSYQHVTNIPVDNYNKFPLYVSIDHGQVNPTAALFCCIDYDGNVIVLDEYYLPGEVVSFHARQIKEKISELGYKFNNVRFYIDPSTQSKNQMRNGSIWSIIDEYSDNGIHPVPANNDVLAGINRVKEFLNKNKIIISSGCINLIREIESYRWKERKSVDINLPEEPVKFNDHAVDALRYFIMTHLPPPKRKDSITIYSAREKYLMSSKNRDDNWD